MVVYFPFAKAAERQRLQKEAKVVQSHTDNLQATL